MEEGVNTPLTSHILGICEIRGRELNPSTRKVVSRMNKERNVNLSSRGFMKGRCKGWTLKIVKWRVARRVEFKPSRWSHTEGDEREGDVTIS
jgi:hypothetical protein